MGEKVDNINYYSGELTPQREMIAALQSVVYLVRTQQEEVFRTCPYKLTPQEDLILETLMARDGGTLTELVEVLGRDKGQIARLVKGLRTRGFVLASEDQEDKRVVNLRLSQKGEKVAAMLQVELDRAAEKTVKCLSESETRQLTGLLRKLRDSLAGE